MDNSTIIYIIKKSYLAIIIVLLFSFFSNSIKAQTLLPDFKIALGSIKNDNYAKIAIDEEGNFYLIACFADSSFFNSQLLITGIQYNLNLAKFDPSGNLIWVKNVAQSKYQIVPKDIDCKDGKIVTCGEFKTKIYFRHSIDNYFDTISKFGYTNFYVSQFSNEGYYINSFGYGQSQEFNTISGCAFLNHNIVITGSFENSIHFNDSIYTPLNTLVSAGSNDIYLVLLDPGYNIIWAKRAGGFYHEKVFGLSIYNNDIYITGSFCNTLNYNTPSNSTMNTISALGFYDIFVAKYDQYGNPHWFTRCGSDIELGGDEESPSEYGSGIAVNKNGVYVIGTCTFFADFNIPCDNCFNMLYEQYTFLSFYNFDGITQWVKEIPFMSGSTSYISSSSDFVAISGRFNTAFALYSNYFQSTIEFGIPRDVDIITILYDLKGDFVTGSAYGGTSSDYSNDLILNKKYLYSTGYFSNILIFNNQNAIYDQVTSHGYTDIFIARFPIPQIPEDTPEDTIIHNTVFQLTPNPAALTIEFKIPKSELGIKYSIYNITGRIIEYGILSKEVNLFDIQSFSAGLYFIKLEYEHPKTFKFIKY